jgi:spoIIIJ-associated protein
VTEAEFVGRTVDEAVARALSAMGATRDEVDVEVVQEPRPALLGLGGREAKVRLTRRASPGQFARKAAEEVLGLMGYDATASLDEVTDTATVTLAGRDMGALIGRHGRTLDALEFLVGLHTSRRHGRRVTVILDAQGYRARRQRALEETARTAADQAASEGKPVFLDPMDPRDRRIVHVALQADARVVTASEGEDDERRVVVRPREDAPPTE